MTEKKTLKLPPRVAPTADAPSRKPARPGAQQADHARKTGAAASGGKRPDAEAERAPRVFGERKADDRGGRGRDSRDGFSHTGRRPAAVSSRGTGSGGVVAASNTLRPNQFDWTAIQQYYAPCPRGLEQLLADELANLGAQDIDVKEGGVGFRGLIDLMYLANLHSRIASRILLRLDERAYRSEADLYRLGTRTDWPALFNVERTIKVSVTAQRSNLRSLDFIALKVKDAVCDIFRDACGERPSVDTHAPDVRIHIFMTDRLATLYIDTSGESLFKRGYRQESVDAPLRENLAAGLLLLSGWNGHEALHDPMCGSGTFLIEAAQIALGLAPGRLRRFGFEGLSGFDAQKWDGYREQARGAARETLSAPITGRDRDAVAVESARHNLVAAGLDHLVDVQQGDLRDTEQAPAAEGVLIANPPYGVRLEELDALAEFYPELGNVLKQQFSGWRAWLLTGDLRLPKLIRLTPSRRLPIYNGALDCRFYEFKLVAGSNR
ncbi:THUMP domain-containing class I SAM-dependent RNA methyltransferase [Amantichitinum ursilacus]|uniref:Ribosomal RNA large subunit methyltransferase L n=1 Tax=Amantichitinum ursilacus TaxID=857265 RepID=A0A0N0GLG2_9NEIS|nr:THUMP domain-containing protein [Amantichitinum ursilacus]KPC50077.1 Ribosomal RNA large subunit methyltransferase L [Amantichitinum ursilacus]